jgi:hypothetical protein
LESAEYKLELAVSQHIRAMPFLWLAVPTRPDGSSDRGFIERKAIALLSCAAGGPDTPSSGWLGSHAASRKVRDSGLRNADHVEDSYDPAFLDVLVGPAGNSRPGLARSRPAWPVGEGSQVLMSNRDVISRGLELLADGLGPLVDSRMTAAVTGGGIGSAS